MNIDFSRSRLVEPFNDLLTFFIFLVCYLRSFLYKGVLFPSFITEAHAQPSAFFFCFQEFIYYFFLYVLWNLFLDIFFLLLVFVLQHSFFDLWVLISNFTLVFMMHWCYHWHLSLKLYWLLSWQLSCFNTCLCNMATSTILTMQSWWLLCW